MKHNKRIGVALSGGGYRAAAYHLGTLKKLHELKILEHVDVISTISGGSIIGAAYCLNRNTFENFFNEQREILSTKNVIRYVITSARFLLVTIPIVLLLLLGIILPFTRFAPWSPVALLLPIFVLVKYQFKLLPISHYIERAYDSFFFHGATLKDLCTTPELAIGSTNLQTCRHFTFSRRKMEDSVYAYMSTPILFDGANFPISKAVMASSSVPFAFTPISIDKIYFKNPIQFKDVDPKLVDGGVYDNQGIHKITQKNSSYACDLIIVSDAGNKLPFTKLYNNTFTLLLRTVETFMTRIKNFQMMVNLYESQRRNNIAYQSLGWNVDECIPGFVSAIIDHNVSHEVCKCHGIPAEWIANPFHFQENIAEHLSKRFLGEDFQAKTPSPRVLEIARSVGTNLRPLSKKKIDALVLTAEALTEFQVKLYLPMLIQQS